MNEIVLGRELTLNNSPAALDLLDTALGQATLTVDCAALEVVDSSAIAVLLEWRRRAKRAQCQLNFINLPASLRQLILVYGLGEVLGMSA